MHHSLILRAVWLRLPHHVRFLLQSVTCSLGLATCLAQATKSFSRRGQKALRGVDIPRLTSGSPNILEVWVLSMCWKMEGRTTRHHAGRLIFNDPPTDSSREHRHIHHLPAPCALCTPGLLLDLALAAPSPAPAAPAPPLLLPPCLSPPLILCSLCSAAASAPSNTNALTTTRSPKSFTCDPETNSFSAVLRRAAMALRTVLDDALERPLLLPLALVMVV